MLVIEGMLWVGGLNIMDGAKPARDGSHMREAGHLACLTLSL